MTAEPSSPPRKKSVALSGVVAGNTALCTVGRSGNDLHYRGYDILDFADQAEFEEVAHLLIHERLPNAAELAAYKKKLRAMRGLPDKLKTALECLPASAHPMDVLRTGCSVLGTLEANLRRNPQASMMWQGNSAETYVWGNARLVDDAAAKQHAWGSGLFPYDMAGFFSSADSPDWLLVEVTPTRAVAMVQTETGLERRTWSVGSTHS